MERKEEVRFARIKMGLRPIPYFLLYQKEAKNNSALRAVLSLRSQFFNSLWRTVRHDSAPGFVF